MSAPTVHVLPTLPLACTFSEVDADELPEATEQGGFVLAVFVEASGSTRYLIATPAPKPEARQ